jgi:ribosomal protein L13
VLRVRLPLRSALPQRLSSTAEREHRRPPLPVGGRQEPGTCRLRRRSPAAAPPVPPVTTLRRRLSRRPGQVLGRLASQIARVLQGKDKPTYSPHSNCGDVVVVVNSGEVALTGNKLQDKLYKRHTGYPGGLKQRTAAENLARDPTSLLRAAVLRMLPRNLLRDDRARKLRLFAGPEPLGLDGVPLVPLEMPPRRIRLKSGLPDDFELPPHLVPMNPEAWAAESANRQKALKMRQEREKAVTAFLQQGEGGAQ